jgi:hypothetical protein
MIEYRVNTPLVVHTDDFKHGLRFPATRYQTPGRLDLGPQYSASKKSNTESALDPSKGTPKLKGIALTQRLLTAKFSSPDCAPVV